MILPNKVIKYEESVIGKIIFLLDELKHKELTPSELYNAVSDKFDDINQFILAVDVLYLLDAIEYEQESEVLRYVKRTAM
jgi:hypothetical protein